MTAQQKTAKTTRGKAPAKPRTKATKAKKVVVEQVPTPEPEPEVVETKVEQESAVEHEKVSKKKRTRYFETYISKVLRQISTESGITSNSKQQLNSSLCVVSRALANMVTQLTFVSNKKTMSEKEVANATRLLLSGTLLENATAHATTSVEQFNSGENKHTSRQEKAGILFPPSIAEKFLRNFGFSKVMVTKAAPVYFAAVLEYLTNNLLTHASKLATDDKRVRITIRDLELAVRCDNDLNALWTRCDLSFVGGGVVPNIHDSLVVKKPRKKRKAQPGDENKSTTKKGHRFRPGTVSLREIRKFQKTSNCLTFAKFPFERLVRRVVSTHRQDMKISKDVFIVLQYYMEQFIVDFLRDANSAAIHSGRVKLMPTDITFINSLRHYGELNHELYRGEKANEETETDEATVEATDELVAEQ